MKNKMQNNAFPVSPFQTGQVWRMGDSKLEVGLVGRTLVHYKHYKGLAKRPPVQLSSKTALEKFLNRQKAVLLVEPAQLKAAGETKGMRIKRKAASPSVKQGDGVGSN